MKKITSLTLIFLLIAALLIGCSASSKSSYDMSSPNMAPSIDSSSRGESGTTAGKGEGFDEMADFDSLSALAPDAGRKMIWNGTIELEATNYDEAYEGLHSLIAETGGYIQSSSVVGEGRLSGGQQRLRNARLTVRIPTENFSLFIKSSGNVATLLRSTTSADDVTDYYFDTEARLGVLKIKEERLIAMLATSETEYYKQLEYIIQIENELANVRYEIESLTGTLRRYDSLISYSTIEVYLSEVEVLTATPASPATVWEQISSRFMRSLRSLGNGLQAFLVWFLGNSPILLVLAVIIFVAVRVWLLIRRRRIKAKANRQINYPPTDQNF